MPNIVNCTSISHFIKRKFSVKFCMDLGNTQHKSLVFLVLLAYCFIFLAGFHCKESLILVHNGCTFSKIVQMSRG